MALRCKTSVGKIPRQSFPLVQTTIIEHLQFIGDDKWYNAVIQALLEHKQPPHTSVSVLERVYRFKTLMEIKNILKGNILSPLILFKQFPDSLTNHLWLYSFDTTNLVWQPFVVTYGEPWL